TKGIDRSESFVAMTLPSMPRAPASQTLGAELMPGAPSSPDPTHEIAEALAVLVARRQHGLLHGPIDADLGIVPGDRAFRARVVRGRDLVEHVRHLARHAEPVREADGNVELVVRFGVEVQAVPAPERRRLGADVERDVEDASAHDADQLRLTRVRLVMQAAQRSPHRPRVVVLHEGLRDARRPVPGRLIRLEKETPRVTKDARLDQLQSREIEIDDFHGPSPWVTLPVLESVSACL